LIWETEIERRPLETPAAHPRWLQRRLLSATAPGGVLFRTTLARSVALDRRGRVFVLYGRFEQASGPRSVILGYERDDGRWSEQFLQEYPPGLSKQSTWKTGSGGNGEGLSVETLRVLDGGLVRSMALRIDGSSLAAVYRRTRPDLHELLGEIMVARRTLGADGTPSLLPGASGLVEILSEAPSNDGFDTSLPAVLEPGGFPEVFHFSHEANFLCQTRRVGETSARRRLGLDGDGYEHHSAYLPDGRLLVINKPLRMNGDRCVPLSFIASQPRRRLPLATEIDTRVISLGIGRDGSPLALVGRTLADGSERLDEARRDPEDGRWSLTRILDHLPAALSNLAIDPSTGVRRLAFLEPGLTRLVLGTADGAGPWSFSELGTLTPEQGDDPDPATRYQLACLLDAGGNPCVVLTATGQTSARLEVWRPHQASTP
jgi:hypothetical protein